MEASYSADLAEDTRDACAHLSPRHGSPSMSGSRARVSRPALEPSGGGGLIAAGVGGGLTGFGADLFLLDDPIKDRQEAASELVRDRIWDWFTEVAQPRLEPEGVDRRRDDAVAS